MTVDITLSQMWFNTSLIDFFFRSQAQRTFEELVERVGGRDSEDDFNELEDRIESNYDSWEDFEEDCYNNSVEEMLDYLCYEQEDF